MESLVLAVAGGTIGIVGAAASSRFARTLLFGVAPQDPVTLVTAVAVLLVVVVAASWLPARRAALIDPGARDEDVRPTHPNVNASLFQLDYNDSRSQFIDVHGSHDGDTVGVRYAGGVTLTAV